MVLLESPLHTFLEAPAAPAAAFARAREPGPSHRFALVFVGVERRRAMHMPTPSAAGAAAAAAAAADGPAAVALPARELWALLRRTFRLRALRMLVRGGCSVDWCLAVVECRSLMCVPSVCVRCFVSVLSCAG